MAQIRVPLKLRTHNLSAQNHVSPAGELSQVSLHRKRSALSGKIGRQPHPEKKNNAEGKEAMAKHVVLQIPRSRIVSLSLFAA
jgi:hypothetical protein